MIATGRQESVRRFIELAASELGWGGIQWQGEGLQETGVRKCKGFQLVGSMENPPTNPEVIEAARQKG